MKIGRIALTPALLVWLQRAGDDADLVVIPAGDGIVVTRPGGEDLSMDEAHEVLALVAAHVAGPLRMPSAVPRG